MKKMNADEHASQLEREIKTPGSVANPALKPLADVATAIKEHMKAKEETKMDRKVAAYQRAGLLAKASSILPSNEPSERIEEKKLSKSDKKRFVPTRSKEPLRLRLRRPFRALGRTLVPIGVVALIGLMLFSGFMPFLQNRQGSPIARSIAELLIPAANAADAFTFAVEQEDAAGASTDTSFIMTSKIDLTADTLNEHVEIVPAMATGTAAQIQPIGASVSKLDDGTFRITPTVQLEPGRVYNVRIVNTAIQNNDGSKQTRTFSWALQTKDVFTILSSVPGDQTSQVPINTGIDVTVNKMGWSDPAAHFKIRPEVKGRFETHGRSIAFVPEKPLEYGTIYTITYDASWGVADSDLVLGEDWTITFETIGKRQDEINRSKVVSVRPSERFSAVAPDEPFFITVYSNTRDVGDITVTGYKLSTTDARAYLEREIAIPDFSYEKRYGGELETAFATTTAFTFNAALVEKNYNQTIPFPGDIVAGRYLVKLTTRDGIASWFFLQITNIATYVTSDKDTTLIWAMDAKTSRPISNAAVAHRDANGTTDAQGLARIQSPAILSSTSTSGGVIMTVGNGDQHAFVRLTSSNAYGNPWSWRYGANDGQTISSIHIDRPLYRPTDTAEIFGFIRDRASGATPKEQITVELNGSDYYWSLDAHSKKYASVSVTPDANGFFRTSLSWSNILPRYYSITLKRGETDVRSHVVEIRDYVKPAYTLSVSLDKTHIAAGEPFTGSIRAAFYDGTPMPNLKLRLRVSPSSGSSSELPLLTNEDGRATFSVKTTQRRCDPESLSHDACPLSSWYSFAVSPQDGEESEVYASAEGTAWHIRSLLRIPIAYAKDNTANINVTAEALDLDQLNRSLMNSYETPDAGVRIPSLDVNAIIWERWQEKIEDGNIYDPITKTSQPKYRYEQRSEIVERLKSRTDEKGSASFTFKMKKDRWYTAVINAPDARGTWTVQRTDIYNCRQCAWNDPENEPIIEFRPIEEHAQDWSGYHVDEDVSYGLFLGSEALPKTPNPSYLYLTAHLGIREAVVSTAPTITMPFTEDLVPNATLYAVVFRNGHFDRFEDYLAFDVGDRALDLSIATDKPAYAPGGTAAVTVTAIDRNGTPKTDARISLALVDEALFDAANLALNNDPRSNLYESVTNGIISTVVSHDEKQAAMMAEGGGGGGDGTTPRANFKDTAAFLVGTTNAEGKATFTVPLPDNITSWRATAIAISPDLYADNVITNIPVTKDVFVNVTVPETLVRNDVPQIKLRAYGKALKLGDKVTYTVFAPSLGLTDASVENVVGESAYLPIEQLTPGDHAVTVTVTTDKGSDAIKRTIHVLESRFQRDAIVRESATTETRLDPGLAKEIDVRFVPKTRAQYLDRLNALRWTWIDRLESRVAKYESENLLRNEFGFDDIKPTDIQAFLKYQTSDGGLAILPYASSDVAVSSQVAALAPELFDSIALSGFFRNTLSSEKSAREEQINALAGLAALGDAVLLDMKSFLEMDDLSWRERLALIRGLSAIGDDASARTLLEPLLADAKTQDDRSWIPVSDDEIEVYQATAEAAAAAARLSDPRANMLAEWIRNSWVKHAYAPVATAAFLNSAVPAAVRIDAEVVYDIGAGPQTLELKDPWPKSVRLTANEAVSFKILRANAAVDLTYRKIVTDTPQNAEGLSIARRFLVRGATSTTVFKEGDDVLIELTLTIPNDAPKGGYTVRDSIPSGFIPVTKHDVIPYSETRYIASPFEGSNPTFTTWAPIKGNAFTITYPVRPVTRGTYAAEPAAVQHDSLPSLTSASTEETITIQ